MAWAWGQPPEYGGKGIGLGLGQYLGKFGGGVKKDGEMALGWGDRGTSLSEMSLKMIM